MWGCRMRVVLIPVVCLALTSVAGARTWTAQGGETLKAEFFGVKEGKVVLKQRSNKRKYVPLENLSLDDRDYIVQLLTSKNRKDQLKALLTRANEQRKVVSASKTSGEDEVAGTDGYGSSGRSTSGQPLSSGEASGEDDEPKTMYGLPIPVDELIQEDKPRIWTDVLGQTTAASFEGLAEPGHVLLKAVGSYSPQRFTLTFFVRSDIEYIAAYLKEDGTRPVFPSGLGHALTQTEQGKGYRTWTDRSGARLNGKFLRKSGKQVALGVGEDGEEQSYPYTGLSDADKRWVDAEVKRLSDANRAVAAARTNRASSMLSRLRSGPGSSGHDGARSGGSGFRYEFRCSRCGHEWTGSSAFEKCSACAARLERERAERATEVTVHTPITSTWSSLKRRD